MAYTLEGTYVASCSCASGCPCPVDLRPTDPEGKGECRGVAAFSTTAGNSQGVDLAGVTWALYNLFPSNISSGGWKVGIVVDESASDDQVEALGKAVSGADGGPFGDFGPLIGEFIGINKGAVSISDHSATINGNSYTFEPHRGGDGNPTTTKNAMFGFAPEFEIGKTGGHIDVGSDVAFDAAYGEMAEYRFSSEDTETHARG